MIKLFCAIGALAALAHFPAFAADTASQRLERFAAETYERVLDLFPFSETTGQGAGPRQDRLELTFSAAHRERQRAHHRWVLQQLETIPMAELTASEKLTHQLLAHRSRDSLAWLAHPFHQHFAFIQIDGGVAPNLIRLVQRQPFRNEADYRAWFRRLRQYPGFLDGIASVLRDGMQSGVTIPRVIVQRALPQVEALTPAEMEKSALWKPMTAFPDSIGSDVRGQLESEYREILADGMYPALRRLAAFVRDEYLPRARTTDGLGALPNGAAMYRVAVRGETTTDMTPDEIHALGLREVTRVQDRLLAAGRSAGFEGPIRDVRAWVGSNPQNYPFASAEDVIAYLQRVHERIVPQLPQLFTRLPKARFEIRQTDPVLAASMPAQWHPPSDDGTRPAIFFMPIVNARTMSTFGLSSLLAHEGLPGHHMEGGIKLENEVPEFRRKLWVTSFGEGWALYAETLGHALGLYEQPLELMGRYASELFRACRLVVDTGLHAKGWTRERAIAYLVDECASTEGNATLEVLRYMVWPAQALSYKIGELTILAARAKAEQRLGSRFDVRAFHDALLSEGHLPLSMMQQRMDAWIEERAK